MLGLPWYRWEAFPLLQLGGNIAFVGVLVASLVLTRLTSRVTSAYSL
jgi:hypothetical protein